MIVDCSAAARVCVCVLFFDRVILPLGLVRTRGVGFIERRERTKDYVADSAESTFD